MSQEAGAVDDNTIRPFTIDVRDEQLEDLRRRIAATRWPARNSSQIGRRACSWRRCRSSPATGRPTTTGASARRISTRSRSSRPRSTGRDPLHPRQVVARGRVAAGHDARLARLGHPPRPSRRRRVEARGSTDTASGQGAPGKLTKAVWRRAAPRKESPLA
jgi:hypothetical protein